MPTCYITSQKKYYTWLPKKVKPKEVRFKRKADQSALICKSHSLKPRCSDLLALPSEMYTLHKQEQVNLKTQVNSPQQQGKQKTSRGDLQASMTTEATAMSYSYNSRLNFLEECYILVAILPSPGASSSAGWSQGSVLPFPRSGSLLQLPGVREIHCNTHWLCIALSLQLTFGNQNCNLTVRTEGKQGLIITV